MFKGNHPWLHIAAKLWLVTGLLFAASSPSLAQKLDKMQIVVFGPPSLGAFLPPIIKAQEFDRQNGLDIEFVQRPPDAYSAQFNSGEFKVGGSAAVLTVGLADTRGVKVSYLFNAFNYWSTVVTRKPDINSLSDLSGRQMAAAKGTTSYAMYEWFAKRQGLDPSTVSVVNTAPPGLVGYALADRADAVQLWEPAYSTLMAKAPDIKTIDLGIDKEWAAFGGSDEVPYLGVAAHTDWIEQNRALIPRLFRAYKSAAEWVQANPEEAAVLIVPRGDAEQHRLIADLIKERKRLGMKVKWASEQAREIEAVYEAGRASGFLQQAPSSASIYRGGH
jgi:NitT/TauT family transport system substrate-binding protein